MHYTTDFIGHIDIAPSLNDDEIHFLSAFRHSPRFERPGGPYDVPGNPLAEDSTGVPPRVYNRQRVDQPGLWCDWEPCWHGCCLAYNGGEEFYDAVRWMSYLIDHFLKPGALASESADDLFAGFTFDHVLEGMVVGCRRDNKELFAIHVADNVVREEVLRAGDQRYVDYPPLPYEEAIDREPSPRQRRRRERRGEALPYTMRPGV